jgi:hypothetical protein
LNNPPILIVDGYNINIYDSLEKAQRNLTPEDLTSRRLKAYDAAGQKLKVELRERIQEKKLLGLFPRQETTQEILLLEHDPRVEQPDELRKLLITWLNLYSQLDVKSLESWSLDDLIAGVLADQQES